MIFTLILAGTASEINSFAGSGPFTHIEITRRAMLEFAGRKGLEVSFMCSEIMMQANLNSDNDVNTLRETYHCVDNDLAGCSFRLDQFKGKAVHANTNLTSLIAMGRAFHLVQDFYSHSNWVEHMQFSMILAPIKDFKDVPPPRAVQSGFYPDVWPNLEEQVACFYQPEDRFNEFIPGATHACLHKDSNIAPRGQKLVPGSLVTYHELAGLYAIKHSVQLLNYFSKTNPWFKTCLVPLKPLQGCNGSLFRKLH